MNPRRDQRLCSEMPQVRSRFLATMALAMTVPLNGPANAQDPKTDGLQQVVENRTKEYAETLESHLGKWLVSRESTNK